MKEEITITILDSGYVLEHKPPERYEGNTYSMAVESLEELVLKLSEICDQEG